MHLRPEFSLDIFKIEPQHIHFNAGDGGASSKYEFSLAFD